MSTEGAAAPRRAVPPPAAGRGGARSDSPAARRPPGRTPARPHPALLRIALVAAGAGLGACTGLAITTEPSGSLSAAGGPAIFAGSLTGLAGTYLALVMVLLASRIPLVERVLGLDGLLRWHRQLAPWPIGLLIAHALLITLGYAQAARTGPWHEAGVLITQFPDILTAVAGLALLCLAGVVSVRAIRRRLRHETWWSVHLYLYLALAISFAHVIVLGPAFAGHPLTEAAWSIAWLATAGLVLCYRFGLPAWRSVRFRLRVVQVRRESPDVVSVIIGGRHLDRLAAAGGQFLMWRFLTPGMWWQAHPYSLSALPRPPYLRLTVKASGDHSAALARLKPGTWVAAEGPYGAFTRQAQRRPGVLLVAAGIGVTALRALLEDLPPGSAPAVLLRGRTPGSLVLVGEIGDLVRRRGGTLRLLTGRRDEVPVTGPSLRALVPDLDQRDVFVCGPEGFVADLAAAARAAGVPEDSVHYEAFAL